MVSYPTSADALSRMQQDSIAARIDLSGYRDQAVVRGEKVGCFPEFHGRDSGFARWQTYLAALRAEAAGPPGCIFWSGNVRLGAQRKLMSVLVGFRFCPRPWKTG